MNLNTLSPEQIAFLYLRHLRYIDVHDQVTDSIKELMKEGIDTQPSLEDLKNNKHIKMLEEINVLLKPIYELIEDTHSDIVSEIKRVVENPMNLPESPIEEEDSDDDDSLF